ncbi:hypothetical protein [Vibrio cholerae]|uniref:hypothetical protein n=1 Tax=Vibrio cholerae TaxID=666 RepID=UPI00165D316C|nr:hypothetical protein [Vibrio cholerae]
MKSSSFSKREWFFVIFIIVIVQFCIQVSAFLYAGSGSALNYISISGTIVSITLALLAIIYSYFQSASQETSSLTISQQVNKLIEVVEAVKVSKDDFSGELSQLQDIREKIDSSMNLQQKAHDKIELVENMINQLNSNSLSEVYEPTAQSKSALFNDVVVKGNNITHITMLIIYYADRYGVPFSDLWSVFGSKVFSDVNKGKTAIQEYFKGALFSTISMFHCIGFVEEIEETLVLSITDEFESSLADFHMFLASRKDAEYSRVIELFESIVENYDGDS